MTDREKLIDDVHSKLMGLLTKAPYIRCEDVHRQYAVNWLMNNGVTVYQWIPVYKKLPKKGCPVLIRSAVGADSIGEYRGRGIWFDLVFRADNVTHGTLRL